MIKNIILITLIFLGSASHAQQTLGLEQVTDTQPVANQENAGKIAIEVPTKSEEENIPVVLESTKKASSPQSSNMNIVWAMGLIGALAAGAYVFIKRYKVNNFVTSAPQIKLITQHYLGPKKSLAIVRVAGESLLIGITDQNISHLKTLSLLDEDVPEETPSKFSSVFTPSQPDIKMDEESKDEFSFSGIKDMVSGKLKNMRSLQ